MRDDRVYYLQRAEQELAAAKCAADPAIAQIHRDMAGRYRDLLSREAEVARPAGGSLAAIGALHA